MYYAGLLVKGISLLIFAVAMLALIEEQTVYWPVVYAHLLIFCFGIAFSYLVDFVFDT